MNLISVINDLFRHLYWADSLMWQSVLKTPSAIEDQTIRQRLHHIHISQKAWLRIWRGKTVDAKSGESLNLDELSRWAHEYHDDVLKYVEGLEEPELERAIDVPGIENEVLKPKLGDTMIQITSHSTYHRGQVTTRLRELGGEPNQTDFIMWIWSGKPKAQWPTF